MTLDYIVRGQAKINMFDYVEEILTAFAIAEPKGAGTKSSAAPDNLFAVNEDCKKLSSEKAVQFHNLVAEHCMPPSEPGRTPVPLSLS
jgi:hypothetical protein